MPKIFDVSVPIAAGMIVWPKDPPVLVEPARRISKGDGANVSQLHMGSHTGTHIDPPFHFIDGGATVDELPLEVLTGPALVADMTSVEDSIGVADLEALRLSRDLRRILFKTRNSAIWGHRSEFPEHYVSLSPEGAKWLVERGVRLIGIDFLSIEKRGSQGHPTHRTLLQNAVVIVEGLDLSEVPAGSYSLTCLPLRVAGGDGAPARAILIQE